MQRTRNYFARPTPATRPGLSLMELMAVGAVLGVIAALIVPRVLGQHAGAKRTACHTNRAEIELQCKLWRRNNGAYPTANLGSIGVSPSYFPEGIPVCPVDGTAYTIDTTSGVVTGHIH